MPASVIVSLIGTVLFLGGFGALNLGLVKSTSYLYQFANLFGALCFTYTGLKPFNAGLVITEAAWALIGAYGLYRIFTTPRRVAAAEANSAELTASDAPDLPE